MTTLHERLAALADDVPIEPADRDLWQRGRRLHHKRRIGTVTIVAACCLLLVGLGVLDWQQGGAPVQPASDTASLAIPEEFHEPSTWLPGTEGEPWDPLIAVMPADRGEWFGTEHGWVGVSAATGEYRFLDLPDIATEGADIALSPDGRYLGYWFSEPMPRAPAPAEWGDPVVGYAVYDVTAGEVVVRETVESEEGLAPETIAWVDRETLMISFFDFVWLGEKAGSGGNDGRTRLHRIDSGSWRNAPGVADAAGSGWVIHWGPPAKARPVDALGRRVRLSGTSAVPPMANPSGTTFAGIAAFDNSAQTGTPNRIGIAEPGANDQARFAPIPGRTRYLGLVGWRDENTVVATRNEPSSTAATDETTRIVVAVDVRTGEETALSSHHRTTIMATGLLDLAVVERPEPPRPWNPWVELAGAGLIVLLGGLGLLMWRRRVGP